MNLFRLALGHLLRCRDVSRLVSQLQDREPTWWERVRLQAHLAVCEYCSRFEGQLSTLREAMKRYRA